MSGILFMDMFGFVVECVLFLQLEFLCVVCVDHCSRACAAAGCLLALGSARLLPFMAPRACLCLCHGKIVLGAQLSCLWHQMNPRYPIGHAPIKYKNNAKQRTNCCKRLLGPLVWVRASLVWAGVSPLPLSLSR